MQLTAFSGFCPYGLRPKSKFFRPPPLKRTKAAFPKKDGFYFYLFTFLAASAYFKAAAQRAHRVGCSASWPTVSL